MLTTLATAVCLLVGLVFFVAGTTGLLRFPDVPSRLHALTKADNLGLGFVALAAALQSDAWTIAKLVLVWLLTLFAAAIVAQLVARSVHGERRP